MARRPHLLSASIALALFALFAPQPVSALSYSDRYRSPRNPERPIRKATTLIVLHTTEAHARSSLNKLCERGEAHYCVVENGTVYRIVDREREAFHAGRSMWNGKENCDSFSVGIEVVGHHDQPVTRQQLDALRELVGNLKKIYRLGDASVVCHSHVAYGAPNKWQKRNHRGRKRCGMLFAMPSVRRMLGLSSKPAADPDVKARRLVQADAYLAQVLYGSTDTMAARYGKGAPGGQTKKIVAAKPAAAPEKEKDGDGLFSGWSGFGFFKKKAKLKGVPGAADEPDPPELEKPAPAAAAKSAPEKPAPAKPQPAPVQKPAAPKQNAKPSTLADLKALPGYVQGGPVSATLSPFKIAGKAWNSPATYYYTRGKVVPGNKIDPKRIERGALLFYKK